MLKHLYILGSATNNWNNSLTEHWRWDSITKWQKIREAIWKIEDQVIKIISSADPSAILTAEWIADWMWMRSYGMNLNHNLCENDCEANLDKAIEWLKQFIQDNLVIIVIVQGKIIDSIVKKLWLNWLHLDEISNLSWYHFEIK